MKKKNIKSLELNKKKVAFFNNIKGGATSPYIRERRGTVDHDTCNTCDTNC